MLQALGSIPTRSFYGRCDPLGAAEVTLSSLHGNVPEKKLNLLQFAAGGAAEPRATSTEIVRREFANANLAGEDEQGSYQIEYGELPMTRQLARNWPISPVTAI